MTEIAGETTKSGGWLKRLALALGALVLVGFILQTIVVIKGSAYILDLEYENEEIVLGLPDSKPDCILVLGAALWDGFPCPMLQERLDTGAELYHAGASDTIIVSGAVDDEYYNEPQAMEDYLVEYHDIPREAIQQDLEGNTTYDSMHRAKNVFDMGSVIVVTEKYHLFRACYDAAALGLETYGADACKTLYFGNINREFRECLARDKDFFMCIIQPELTYEGTTE